MPESRRINLNSFHNNLEDSLARGYPLNEQQREAVDFGEGLLWLLAGPGSGKTEVLVTRTLKLICVDGVEPGSIMLTTFTKKAALNLEDRLAAYMVVLQNNEPHLKDADIADLRVGTIHSLCNDILHEYRFPDYQNVRLLDDVEQHLFTYRHAEIANNTDIAFWGHFDYILSRWNANSTYPPNKWQRARAAVVLFNHIVEDCVNLEVMRNAGNHWETLVNYYEQYEQSLRSRYSCDFAHLQLCFLNFIESDAGVRFLRGDGIRNLPLRYVLVDEYQDTNPIQERIYLSLAQSEPHNLTVVGDDDQALYRFRGGTVACMVNFDQACQTAFNQSPQQIQLEQNYRSHTNIVDFVNNYIATSPQMQIIGVRAPNKSQIRASSSIVGNYPSVNWIQSAQARGLPIQVANFIQNHLIADRVIEDLSQCVILMRSTKDSPRNAGPLLREFSQRNIPVYNPRSKSFMDSEEVQCLLAGLIRIIDPSQSYLTNLTSDLPNTVREWATTFDGLMRQSHLVPLREYVSESVAALPSICQRNAGRFLKLNLIEILYRLLSLEPFETWKTTPERNLRLSKVTRLFESYQSFNLGTILVNSSGTGIDDGFLNRFYYTFISYLLNSGIDDDEDEEVIVPRGYLPMMTIHQSKGLEFPFVIVTNITGVTTIGAAQFIEQEFSPFRNNLYPRTVRPPQSLAEEDAIRLFYVAYSRAQYGLIIAAAQNQITNSIAVPNATEFRRRVHRPIV